MINSFKGTVKANTVADKPVFGVTLTNQKPYCIMKVAKNNGKDFPASFFSICTYNTHAIEAMKKAYKKGMVIVADITDINCTTTQPAEGIYSTNVLFVVDDIHEVVITKLESPEGMELPIA